MRELTAIGFGSNSFCSREFHSMRIDAPTKTKCSVALQTSVVSPRITDRRHISRGSSANRCTWSLRFRETAAPFWPAYVSVTANTQIRYSPTHPLSLFIFFYRSKNTTKHLVDIKKCLFEK